MGHDAANLMGVVELDGAHLLGRAAWLEGVCLREEALSSVVEKATDNSGALDEPRWRKTL